MAFKKLSLSWLFLSTGSLFASSEPGASLNYYHSLADFFGLPGDFAAVFSSLLTLVATFALGLHFKRAVTQPDSALPPKTFSLRFVIEEILSFVYGLTKQQCGENYRAYLPLTCGIFLYILMTNLSGLVPGFAPATENFSSNLGMGLIVFGVYNFAGIKEHGAAYIKQFLGPLAVLAPLLLVLELISHCVRPVSLALRLTANIFGDHLVLGVFSILTPLVIPAVLLFFGLLVAGIQSFVFTMLTCVYINMAISHDH